MALNFSHRHVSEEPMKIADGYLVEGEGVSESNGGDVFSHPWRCSSIEKGDCFDVLPSDPFGMDMNNTFTAWLEDSQYERDEIGIGDGDHQLFAGLSLIWNNAMRFQESSVYSNGFEGDGPCPGAFISPTSDGCNNDEGEIANIHPAFSFCLYQLELKDLLSVSMVCKSLHTTVCDDSLLWKHIHISHPLNEKFNDEALLQLTERAHGTMQCLRLVDCTRITEDCLRKVLERSPLVVKLGVPGCIRISIDGLVSILRDLKSTGKLKVKHLKIGGLFGVTKDHYDELVDLLNIDNHVEQSVHKPPRFYHRRYSFATCDDVRGIDIEMCRKCENWRLVYDCPAEDCKGKEECRACALCVQRCSQCGRCINGGVYEETFSLEFLCSGCSKLHKSPPFD